MKKTVNFDDPGTYHFYFGDAQGSRARSHFLSLVACRLGPARHGRNPGNRIARSGIRTRLLARALRRHGVSHDRSQRASAARTLPFKDPDGMALALVAVPGAESEPAWCERFRSGRIRHPWHSRRDPPAGGNRSDRQDPCDVLGFAEERREGAVTRFRSPDTEVGGIVDLREVGGFPADVPAPVRCITSPFARPTMRHRQPWCGSSRRRMASCPRRRRIATTSVRSISASLAAYSFEIATDVPGFAVDESPALLGEALKLPAFLEARRGEIAARLPDLGDAA